MTRKVDSFDVAVLAWCFGLLLGLLLGLAMSNDKLSGFHCTEYSPVTGQCVVFTNQQEKRRYD